MGVAEASLEEKLWKLQSSLGRGMEGHQVALLSRNLKDHGLTPQSRR